VRGNNQFVTRYSVADRFWAKVQKTDSCWLWDGGKSHNGYGVFSIKYKGYRATHVAWFLTYGKFPTQWLLHSCDNPSCVNPLHLHEGSAGDNNKEKVERGRCPQGINVYNARFTEQDIRDIRSDKRYLREIAVEYGVHLNTIHAIKSGKNWKHVKEPEVQYGV